MNKIFTVLLIISSSLLMTACSPEIASQTNTSPTEEASVPAKVFECTDPQIIRLEINSTPIETKAGFIRLVGILKNDLMAAVIEISGKGLLVKKGDFVSNYKVSGIFDKEVVLCLGKL